MGVWCQEPTKQSCECECVPAKTTQGIQATSLTGDQNGIPTFSMTSLLDTASQVKAGINYTLKIGELFTQSDFEAIQPNASLRGEL